MTNPAQSSSRYPAFYTACALCGEGDQVATRREDGEDGVSVYVSRCADCQDGFSVRVPYGSPDEERKAFLAWGGSRWREE